MWMPRALSLPLLLLASCAAPPPAAAPPPPPPPAPPPPAPAAPMTPLRALERLFSAARASEAWFGPQFLAKVPTAKIDAVVSEIRASLGAFKGVQVEGNHYLVHFERGSWEATVKLDAEGRFTTLFVRPAEPKTATLEEAIAGFRALPGKVSVLVLSDGVERAAIEPDAPLGVGSAFKLAVLSALRTEIDAKKRGWRDVIELDRGHRSLPSGILQSWPERAPLTLYALAGLMISISDNTATDTLLGLVGRERVEAFAPRNKPFLMTREVFQLKESGGREALAAYRKGGEAERRKVLAELSKQPLPSVESYPTEPTALDVEWFFSVRELCGLMKKVQDLPLMRINPGPAKKSDWDSVAYKGGSEPGVVNMTTWVEKGGHAHCVSATWNAEQKLDGGAFDSAYTKALVALRGAPKAAP